MSDPTLIERLRHCSKEADDPYLHELTGRAADEIERLRAALREISRIEARRMYETCPDCDSPSICEADRTCTAQSLSEQVARAALAAEGENDDAEE